MGGSISDILGNLDALAKTPTAQAMAKGVTGAPITPDVPNPGNPVSGMAQGAIAPTAQDALGSTTPPSPSLPPTAPISAPPALNTPPIDASQSPVQAPSASSQPAAPAASTPPAPITIDPSEDQRRREAMDAEREHKRRMSNLTGAVGGIGDAISTAAQAFGVHGNTNAQDEIMKGAQERYTNTGTEFEAKLKQDPTSDVSKSYRAMVQQIVPALAKNPNFTKMSAQEIGDKIPMIDTMMKAQAAEDTKRMQMQYMQSNKDLMLGEKNNQFDQKEWDKITKDTNPTTATRRTPLGSATMANNNADRALMTLNKPVVTNQEAGNVMADVASIYQNGSPTQFGMSHQAYNTLYGKVNGLLQSVTGKPQDALPNDIKQRLIQTLTDLKSVNAGIINTNMDYIEKAQPKLIANHADEWQSMRSLYPKKVSAPAQGQAKTAGAAGNDPLGIR